MMYIANEECPTIQLANKQTLKEETLKEKILKE